MEGVKTNVGVYVFCNVSLAYPEVSYCRGIFVSFWEFINETLSIKATIKIYFFFHFTTLRCF